ncbi:MAG: glycosyltransferase, partial [Thermoleophilaceae bacterium]|nr:glycosyltransferase [Thermoleophilaceae bacterium]
MRVGLFHATLPEPGRKPGGVELFVHRLAQELVGAGHEVTALSFSDPPADSTYCHARLSPRGIETSTLARLTLVPALLNRADTSGLDVLHLHGDDWFYLRRPLPTVRTFHGFALYEARHGTRLRLRARQLATYPLEAVASRLATASYAVNDRAIAPLYRVDGVLHNGVSMTESGAPTKSKVPSILFVGTWEGRKRGRFLRDVFERQVLPALPAAELW